MKFKRVQEKILNELSECYKEILASSSNQMASKGMATEESKDLSTLLLDELIGNLKVYEVVLEKDSEENNRAVTPTPRTAIVAIDLGDDFTVKGHHLSKIKDHQFDGRAWANPYKSNDKAYRLPSARTEHVNFVCTRSGKTYDPPVNLNDKVTIIYDDSDDEAEEKHKEENITLPPLNKMN
uniref:Reverse transcriptase domain-containing protein n=1 Tax=Tanacetum cinerariifolium TaxID=118510 RepID=A0A699GIZ3_TANCI|nr:reverse transcriptase domain-containing protein [Tanacetum cinerariifolium]